MSISDTVASRRVKPGLTTRFHIDYDWWVGNERELRAYLISHLPLERQNLYQGEQEDKTIDWIDPETAEVRRVDGLHMALQEAAKSTEFITEQTSLVDAVFRVFLANGNTPLTPIELSEETGRPAQMILRTIAGTRVYRGIRPAVE